VSDLEVRAGDDERQATIDRLAQHFRAGRLSAEELEERTAAAHAARTRGDLATLEADLPTAGGPGPSAATLDRSRRTRERAVSIVAISVFLWIIWAVTSAGFPWPIFPTAAMVLGFVLDTWGGREPGDGPRGRR
jgi:Domain of unknown function (DUF1707)